MASIKYSAELDTSKLDKSIKDSNKTIGDYAKKVEKAGGEMDRAFDKSTKNLKEAIVTQKALVKELENDVKNLEKAYKNMTPGAGAQKAARTLADTKAYLSQEQERLIQLQHEQIQVNKEEEASANSLQGMIGKWALSLGGAAAALGAIKRALSDTTAGFNLFNIVGESAKQIMYNLVSGSHSLTAGLKQVIEAQRKLNDLRLEEKISTYEATQQKILYNKYLVEAHDQTLTTTERIKAYDKAIEAHNKMVDLEIATVKEQIALTEELLEVRPGSDKLKLQYADLNTTLMQLEARRYSALKEMTSMRSGLVKKETEDEKKRREMLDNWLKAIEEEQIERAQKNAETLKKIRQDIDAGKLEGKDKELFLLEQKYKEDLELYKDSEAIKMALTEKYAQDRYTIEMKYLDKVKAENAKMTAALLKIDPGKGFSMLNRTLGDKAIDVSGMKGLAKGSAAWADKMSEEITENTNESLKRQIELRRQITVEAANLVYQIGETLGLDDESLEKLDGLLLTITRASSGDIPGAVSSLLTTILSQIDVTDKFADKVERLNKLIDRQNDLIRESERLGGTEGEMRKRISLLNEQLALLQEELKKAEKSQEGWFNWFAASNKEVQNLKDNIQDVQDTIDDATQELKDYMGGWVTENTIAEAIAEGFASGKTSVDDFAEYMNEVLRDAILNKFMSEMLGPAMTELQEYISLSLSDNVLTAEEKAEIDQRVKAIADSNKELWDDLSGALNMGESPTTGMMGIARQLTEETGAELAGLWRRSADDQRQMRDYTKEGVNHLVAIEHNTYNTVEELRVAVNELRDINSNTKPVYSGDM